MSTRDLAFPQRSSGQRVRDLKKMLLEQELSGRARRLN